MRTAIIILIFTILAFAAIGILVQTTSQKRRKFFDERVSMREEDKIPYGYYVVRKVLPGLFNGADVKSSLRSPLLWQVDNDSTGKVVFFPCLRFNASAQEMKNIYRFASAGNHVYIISRQLSFEAKNFLDLTLNGVTGDGYSGDKGLTVKLVPPLTTMKESFSYKGKKYSSVINTPDSSQTYIFGTNDDGAANFIQKRAGKGTITIHLAPLAYSNYFLLQNENIRYLEKSFSAIPGNITSVEWNEFYFTRKAISSEKEPNWLSVLFQFPSFRWAFLTALALIVLFALLEGPRRQRLIPVLKKPVNDSLDFVQTIGRLYYDRKDHKDLGMKMTWYFLEDVRNRYKLPTTELDAAFADSLQKKSGYPADETTALVNTMNFVLYEPDISEEMLYRYHKQLEKFYQFS